MTKPLTLYANYNNMDKHARSRGVIGVFVIRSLGNIMHTDAIPEVQGSC